MFLTWASRRLASDSRPQAISAYRHAGPASHLPGTGELTCQSHGLVYELTVDALSGDGVPIIVLDIYGPGQP